MSETKTQNDTQPVKENRKYAILMETNEDEPESWYNFILYQGNEEALNYLNKQLESIHWVVEEGLSTFDLELENLVSEQTAKEMIRVDLNHCFPHRKFDGTLQKIDLGFDRHKSKTRKMEAAFKLLGEGGIDKFIDQEDIDPNDPRNAETDSEAEETEESETEESGSEESRSDRSRDKHRKEKKEKGEKHHKHKGDKERKEKKEKKEKKGKEKLEELKEKNSSLSLPGFAKGKAKRR